MDSNCSKKEFKKEECLRNLYVAPSSRKILEAIENAQTDDELIKNILL
jgi:hypothetical protein